MEIRLTRDKQINFRTDEELFESAKKIFEKNNLDVTNAFNLFLEQTVFKNDLPFENIEEIEKEKLILKLRSEIQKSWESLEAGHGISIAEARKNLWNTK